MDKCCYGQNLIERDLFGWAPGNADAYELEEGEWIPDDDFDATQSSEHVSDEGIAFFLLLAVDHLVSNTYF